MESEETKCTYICYFLHKVFFTINVITLILLIIYYIKVPFIYDQCFRDDLYNLELSPIYEISLSDEKTEDSIKFGELEEYSNINITIQKADIYKWRNKYFNVKRLDIKLKDLDKDDYDTLSPIPINHIKIDKSQFPSGNLTYKTLKIDNDYYLHYTNERSTSVIVDLKISHTEPFTHENEENNICFIPYCSIKENKCQVDNEKVDIDSTNNFINNNNLKLDIKISNRYYEPKNFGLYIIKNKYQDKKTIEKLFYIDDLLIPFLIINISLRIIKLSFLCFLEMKSCCRDYCSWFNLINPLIHFINFILLAILYNEIYDKNNYIAIYGLLELLNFPLSIFLKYTYLFLKEKDYTYKEVFCCFCKCPKKIKYEIKKKIVANLKREISRLRSDIDRQKYEFSNIEANITKTDNKNKINKIHNENLRENINIKKNKYENINIEFQKAKDLLKSRKEYLQK